MKRVYLAVLCSLIPLHGYAQDERRNTERIDPAQLRQIQTLGQSVLTAKHGAVPDAELTQLRQRVQELREALVVLGQPVLSDLVVAPADASVGTAKGSVAARQLETQGKYQAAEDRVRRAVTQLRQHRTAIAKRSSPKPDEHRAQVAARAAHKAQELETEIEQTLSAPPQERTQRLQALRERLQSRRLLEQPPSIERTPTLTTLTRHRE